MVFPAAGRAGTAPPGLVAVGVVASAAVAVGAAFAPLLTIGFAVAAALAVVTVGNLTYGVALFTLLTFFETLPGLEGVALSRPFGLILVVSWLAALARSPKKLPLLPRDRPALAYLLVLLLGWAAMSASWAADSAVAMSSATRLALIVVLIFVVFTALRTPRDLVIVAWAFLAGAFLVSVVSIATGGNKAGRLALGELDPNFLAASLAAALSLALFLVWGTAHRGVRLLLVGFMGIYAVAIVLTQSRAALVALGVAAVAAAVFGGQFRGRVVGTIIVIAALGIGYYAIAAPSDVRARAASTVSDGRDPRLDSWAIALRITAAHPAGGVGLGNFTVVESSYLSGQTNLFQARKLHNTPLVAHNIYLEVMSELGVVGLVLFLAVLVATIVPAVRCVEGISSRSAYAGLTTRGLIVALIVLLTAYFFVSGTYAKHLWLLLGVLAAVTTVARNAGSGRTTD